MKKALIAISLIAGVALCWAAPPDRLPPLAVAPAEARTVVMVGGSAPAPAAGCTACNSSNDSSQADSGITTTAVDNSVFWLSFKFTLTASKCVTGAYFLGHAYNETSQMYITADSSGSPAGTIANAVSGCTKTLADMSDTNIVNDYMFDSTVTLEAGTYWVVWSNTGSAGGTYYGYANGGGGENFKSSSNGTSWTQEDSYPYKIGVYGCDPS